MKFKCVIEYEYPVEHKPPVKAEIVLHGDRVTTDKISPYKDRPHGTWKRISMDKYIRHASYFYRCSVCGEDIIGETNFCPNCGADMREGDSDA